MNVHAASNGFGTYGTALGRCGPLEGHSSGGLTRSPMTIEVVPKGHVHRAPVSDSMVGCPLVVVVVTDRLSTRRMATVMR